MMKTASWTLMLCLTLGLAPLHAEPPEKPHVDWEGNPLPAEAIARIGSTRFRLPRFIVALALSPDDKTLACLCQDKSLNFLDATTGKLLRRFPLAAMPYDGEGLRFQADGRTVALFMRGVYRVVDVATGKDARKQFSVLRPSGGGHDFSADGKRLVAEDGDQHIGVYDLESGKRLCKIPYEDHGIARYPVFTPDGRYVAVANGDPAGVKFHDAMTGQLQFVVPQLCISLGLSPDGKHLATPPMVWDLEKRKPAFKIDVPDAVQFYPVVYSTSGKHIVLGQRSGHSLLVDATTGKILPSPRIEASSQRPAFSKDGKKMFSGSRSAIQPWDLEAGKPILPGPDPVESDSTLAPHGADLLIAGDALTTVDWQTGRPRRRFPVTNSPTPAKDALSPDGHWIALDAGAQDAVRLMEAKSGKVIHTLPLRDERPQFVQFSPGSDKVVCFTSDRAVVCWEVSTGKQLFRARDFGKRVSWFLSSPDGRQFATYRHAGDGQETEIRVWQAGHDRPHRSISLGALSFHCLDFSMDGKTLLLASGEHGAGPGTISLLDVSKAKVIKSFTGAKEYVQALTLSLDGRTVAYSGDGKLILLEAASGRVRHSFTGHEFPPHAMLFNPDNSLLAAASPDAPVFIWDVYGKHLNKRPGAEAWNDTDRQRLWNALASDDATVAFQSIRALVQSPKAALRLLDKHLQAAVAVEQRRFLDLVKELGDENFGRRKKALAELEKLGDSIEGWMLRETEGGHPLEVQRRLEQVLTKMATRSGFSLRGTRALETLEQIGGLDARRLVARLADGFPAAGVTREATETLTRMRVQAGNK